MPSESTLKRRARVTPYSKSSRKKSGAQSPSLLPDYRPTTDQLETLKGLLSKTWHLYHVSPLWRLETSTAQLRAYSQLLMGHLAGAGDGITERSADRGALTAKISVLPRFGLDGSNAVQVTVAQRSTRSGTPLVECVLCKMNEVRAVKEGFTPLPLLIQKGQARISQQVFQWLQATFDCHITQLKLDQEDLAILVGHYATAKKEGRSLGKVELVYSLPAPIKEAGLSTISVELSYESACDLWSRVEKLEGEEDRRKAFVKTLCDNVHESLHMKLTTMRLSRISTPVIHAEETGKIKVTSAFIVIPVLQLLQSRYH